MSEQAGMLVTADELGQHMGRAIAEDAQADADEAIKAASAAVNHAAQRTGDDAWTADTVPGIARLTCLRSAARLLNNPEQRTTYTGPEGLSYSGSPSSILSKEERGDLAAFRLDRTDMLVIRPRPAFG